MDLIKNNQVIFNEEKHTYTLIDSNSFDTRLLQGVTRMVKQMICPQLYNGVDEATLAKAAEHGHKCHKLCEDFDNGLLQEMDDHSGFFYKEGGEMVDEGLEELRTYIELCGIHDLYAEASEYLVSDNENFASCIDKVLRDGQKEFSILDFKFTYNFEREPVMWQTSLYADWFEKQNPGAKVKKLYCMHIKYFFEKDEGGNFIRDEYGRPKQKQAPKIGLHELKRVPSEHLEELKRCWLNEIDFENPLAREERTLELAEELQAEYNEVLKGAAEFEKRKKAIMEELKQLFSVNPNTSKFKGVFFTVNQSAGSHSVVLDEERLKAEEPEIYKRYFNKVKVVSPRTTVTFNKIKTN